MGEKGVRRALWEGSELVPRCVEVGEGRGEGREVRYPVPMRTWTPWIHVRTRITHQARESSANKAYSRKFARSPLLQSAMLHAAVAHDTSTEWRLLCVHRRTNAQPPPRSTCPPSGISVKPGRSNSP